MEARRWKAGLAGLAASAAMGALMTVFGLGRLGLLLPLIVGVVAGSVVRSAGKRRPGLAGTAATATACGLALGSLATGLPVGALLSGRFIVWVLMATVFAALVAGR